MRMINNPHNPNRIKTAAESAPSVPVYAVEQLFGGARHVRLMHNGHEYRLSLTKADKLILTK